MIVAMTPAASWLLLSALIAPVVALVAVQVRRDRADADEASRHPGGDTWAG